MAAEPLTDIPLVDLRDGGTVRHAAEGVERAKAIRDDCLAWFPSWATPVLPMLDGAARRWLSRSASPYKDEIAAVARVVKAPGVWFLNATYQVGCTALAREQDGVPWLARTLDWPFRGLGRRAEVARMRGAKGDFLVVTWPGYVGALTGMAPGRFSVAINQAPMRRRTRRPALRLCDLALNAAGTWRLRHLPPDHLLRHVLETCADFAAARRAIETTPLARPAIFTLAGCAAGERAVIERTVTGTASRSDETAAANDWLRPDTRWEARMGSQRFFTCTSEEAREGSVARRTALRDWPGRFGEGFAWVRRC